MFSGRHGQRTIRPCSSGFPWWGLGAAVALAGFVTLARRDWNAKPPGYDAKAADWLATHPVPGGASLTRLVSWPGWPPQNWIIIAAAGGALAARGLKTAALVMLAAIPAGWLVTGIKHLVGRARPASSGPASAFWPSDPSFPSGHTTQYTLLFGFLAHLARRHLDPGPARRLALCACAIPVVLVGPARLYQGHHWPSDVVAGYSLGLAMLLAFIQAYELFRGSSRDRA